MKQKYVVAFCFIPQLVFSLLWALVGDPRANYNTTAHLGTIIIECILTSPLWAFCSLAYLILLTTLCLVLASKAHKNDSSLNEGKFITYNMLFFFMVVIAFIPAYISTQGKHTIISEMFAIIALAFAFLGCSFVPKCYKIYKNKLSWDIYSWRICFSTNKTFSANFVLRRHFYSIKWKHFIGFSLSIYGIYSVISQTLKCVQMFHYSHWVDSWQYFCQLYYFILCRIYYLIFAEYITLSFAEYITLTFVKYMTLIFFYYITLTFIKYITFMFIKYIWLLQSLLLHFNFGQIYYCILTFAK